MSAILVVLLCMGIGALLGVQPVINARLAETIGSPVSATFVSLAVSIVCVVPVAAVAGVSFRTDAIGEAPWWIWIGGVSGAAFVAAGMLLAPRIGVTLLFASVIAGQLVAAALVDHNGWFDVPVRPVDPLRILGIALVFAGVIVFRLASAAKATPGG